MRVIKLFNPHLPMYPAIAECIKSKDLLLTRMETHPHNDTQVIIQDKNLEVKGIQTIIQYLDEKFPHPPLFPPEPEKRALIRMATDEIATKELHEILTIYRQSLPANYFFAGLKPTVLDLFLLGLSTDHADWSDFRSRF